MANEENRPFRERLTALRRAAKMTQAELAEELCISRSTLANYESGERCPSLEMMQDIADYFKVSLDYLVARKAPPNDIDEFMSYRLRTGRYINKEGCLDLSMLSAMDKISIIEYYKFLIR